MNDAYLKHFLEVIEPKMYIAQYHKWEDTEVLEM